MRLDPADFPLAGKKDQDAAVLLLDRLRHQPRHRRLEPHPLGRRSRQPARLDREGAPFRAQDRRVLHQRRDRGGVQRRRHDEDHQVGPQRAAHLPRQCQAQVGVQRSFVEFVEDDRAHPRQPGIGLDDPRQDAFGHHLDPGGGGHFRLAPDAIAHALADGLSQRLGHPFGRRPRRQAPRLQHQDPARDAGLHQRQRHARCLARAGRRLQDGPARGLQRGAEVGQHGVDGQGFGEHAALIAGSSGLCHRACPSPPPRPAPAPRLLGRRSA